MRKNEKSWLNSSGKSKIIYIQDRIGKGLPWEKELPWGKELGCFLRKCLPDLPPKFLTDLPPRPQKRTECAVLCRLLVKILQFIYWMSQLLMMIFGEHQMGPFDPLRGLWTSLWSISLSCRGFSLGCHGLFNLFSFLVYSFIVLLKPWWKGLFYTFLMMSIYARMFCLWIQIEVLLLALLICKRSDYVSMYEISFLFFIAFFSFHLSWL